MPTLTRALLPALFLGVGHFCGAMAQAAPITVTEDKKGLLKMAKVAPADAIRTAQARFPAATMKSGEIEREDGKLIYSFELQQPGVKGIEEVNVDAISGAIVGTEHENPKPPKKPAPKPSVGKSPVS